MNTSVVAYLRDPANPDATISLPWLPEPMPLESFLAEYGEPMLIPPKSRLPFEFENGHYIGHELYTTRRAA